MTLESQADRAGVPTAAPQPEREWTDLQALARAVAQTKSREEGVRAVRAWWAVRDDAERERPAQVGTIDLPATPANDCEVP